MLNHESPVPLYYQLANLLMAKIRSGEYASGSKIPSEHVLADRYHIGRPTVRQATDILIRKKMLVRKRGSGTFVRSEDHEIDLFSFAGTIYSFQQKGVAVSTRVLKKVKLVDVRDDPENPFYQNQAYFFSRLSRANREPVLIEDFYFHPDLFKGIEQLDISAGSISRLVDEHFYMRPTSGKQNYRISHLKGKNARNLDVPPTMPILLVKRFLNFKQADNAVFSRLYCRTDRFVFSQTIGGVSND